MKILNIVWKNKLLFGIFLIYIILLFIKPEKAYTSFNHTTYYLIEMIQILPIVFILTSLIETWVPKNMIMNGLGKKSGIKGILLSFFLGSLSAGPIYAAFPICKMLLKKGASIMNIVIILSAWAVIKVPMLANEAKFLGLEYMGVRWGLTVISILIIGYLMQIIVKEVNYKDENRENDTITGIQINQAYCIGCGVCERKQPSCFKVIDKKAEWIASVINNEETSDYEDTIESCPVKVIEFEYQEKKEAS